MAIPSGKWEIFGTPEYIGGAPAPTDYVTLIAEVSSTENDKRNAMPPAGDIWIAPESARPWLSNNFRTMLANFKNLTVDFSGHPECRSLRATLRQTKKWLKAFPAIAMEGRFYILPWLTILNLKQQKNEKYLCLYFFL